MNIITGKNKKSAIEFYKTAYMGNLAVALGKYVGSMDIQYNPLAGQ